MAVVCYIFFHRWMFHWTVTNRHKRKKKKKINVVRQSSQLKLVEIFWINSFFSEVVVLISLYKMFHSSVLIKNYCQRPFWECKRLGRFYCLLVRVLDWNVKESDSSPFPDSERLGAVEKPSSLTEWDKKVPEHPRPLSWTAITQGNKKI